MATLSTPGITLFREIGMMLYERNPDQQFSNPQKKSGDFTTNAGAEKMEMMLS